MIRDDMVTLLARRLTNRTDIAADIILEMQIAQSSRLEQNGRFLPWFLVTEFAVDTTDIGENRVPVPNDFLAEVEGQKLWVWDETAQLWKELYKDQEDDLAAAFLMVAPGMPQAYALVGDHFTIFPTPDQAYQLRIRYAAADDSLANNIENKWLKYAPDLMIAEVGAEIAKTVLQNEALAVRFESGKAPAWDRLWRMHEAREHTNQDYSMSGG